MCRFLTTNNLDVRLNEIVCTITLVSKIKVLNLDFLLSFRQVVLLSFGSFLGGDSIKTFTTEIFISCFFFWASKLKIDVTSFFNISY